VIAQADAAWILPQRAGRPLFLVDLAVPRNIDPALKTRQGLRLYDIDDLQAVAQATLAVRQQELGRCAGIIEEQTAHFARRWKPIPHKEDDPCQVAEVSSPA
jgi:glutamyl-tRNA reductase